MKRKLTAIITAAALLIISAFTANAAVYTVDKPTNGDTIYIAGDPDMYPIEYYDTQAKEYKGIVPELYKKISDSSGIDFSYINSGTSIEQYRLAINKQVEIVSAHHRGDIDDLLSEVHILTYNDGGEPVELCIGFTSIAPDNVVNTVTAALQSASSEEILRFSVETAVNNSPNDFPYWLLFVIGGLVILVIVLTVINMIRRKKEKLAKQNRLADPVTGIGNSLYFEQWYGNFISPASSALYYIAYIGVDIQQILQFADAAVSEEIQIYAASELAAESGESDFCARISDGRFALAFEAPIEEHVCKSAVAGMW